MLDQGFFRRYRAMPAPFWEWVGSRAWRGLERLTRTEVIFEGLESVPRTPVIFATNSTQKYDFMPIRVDLSSANEHVILRVIDEGQGVPAALREAVFDKYFQVDHEDHPRPSHGLGLAFCRLAVEAHQGTIEVEAGSTGCVFRVTLPSLQLTAQG